MLFLHDPARLKGVAGTFFAPGSGVMLGEEFAEYIVKAERWFQHEESRKLFSLCLRGFSEGSAGALYKNFTQLGILHLLVLSGSQVSHYSYALNRVLGLFRKILPGNSQVPLEKSLYYRGAMVLGLVVFGEMVAWAPPVTRAIAVFLAALLLPRWHVCLQMGIALLGQVLIFPEHLQSLGFFLSWMSFFFLVFFDHLQIKGVYRLVVLCVFCQGFVIAVKGLPWPSGELWFIYIMANLLLGFLFDRFVFPLTGWVLALSFGTLFLDIYFFSYVWEGLFWVIVQLFEAVARAALVLIQGIQYIR